MRSAMTVPMVPPIRIPLKIRKKFSSGSMKSVTRTAMPMPIMPSLFPRRLVSGCDKPLSARMKQILAPR